ncbi:hypothetical protein PENTCL1PPCAC_22819, partial [Pristionchus entomophagus]
STISDNLLNGRVEDLLVLLDAGSDRQIDVFVSNVDDETSDDRWLHVVCHRHLLALLHQLGKSVIQRFLMRLGKRLGGSDLQKQLSSMSAHNGLEGRDDSVQLIESTIVSEKSEEVGGLLRQGKLLSDGGDSRLLLSRLQSGIETTDSEHGVLLENIANCFQILVDGFETVALVSSRVESGGIASLDAVYLHGCLDQLARERDIARGERASDQLRGHIT